MQTVEFRFMPKPPKYGESFYDDAMLALLDEFLVQLARNGLILEGGATTTVEGCELVMTVIAQDEYAIDEKYMSYDTRQLLKKILQRCKGLPKVIPKQNLIYPAHCTCSHHDILIMQSPPLWEGSPVMCGDCGRSIPLYQIVTDSTEREFDDMLHWRKLRLGYLEMYECGVNQKESETMLKGCASDLSLSGRRLAGMVEAATGVMTLYPLFSRFEQKPDKCPQCGGDWVNHYTDAVKYERFCRACRLVM